MAAKQLYDDDDALDESGILKDGRTIRVGMQFRDSLSPVQRAIADSKAQLHDGLGNPAGHKPGYAFVADSNARARLQDAYDSYDAQQAEAWRSPANLKQDEAKPVDRRMTLDEVYREREIEDENAWRAK